MKMSIDRRQFMLSLVASGAVLSLPGLSLAAAPTERRFVFVMLRGGMDGLAAIPPYADPAYAAARGALALPASAYIDLNGFFGLNAALAPLYDFYRKGEMLAVQAVHSPYRERSHFDGQEVLEGGGSAPHRTHDGWLNRTLSAIDKPEAMAIGQNVPLALRGEVPVASWAPSPLAGLSQDMAKKLAGVYSGDQLFSMALEEGVQSEAFVAGTLGEDMEMKMGGKAKDFVKLAEAAGKLMAAATGPRIAMLELGGWDTHTGQGTEGGRIAEPLSRLANGILALAQSLGQAWSNTVLVAVSEFGRTVAANGTGGSDHGTAGAALVLGGAVKGGRVIANWPGLAKEKLYQGRDLAPTLDIRSLLKGLLKDHLGVAKTALDSLIFPESAAIPSLEGLLRR
jgi:uncharacterized protein (DUF1501 family)